jgi:hypothetical protein
MAPERNGRAENAMRLGVRRPRGVSSGGLRATVSLEPRGDRSTFLKIVGQTGEASAASATTYRADIDGLRAVANLGVVAYHFGLGVPGGYGGVDVFFVISGFLIAGITKHELETGMF